MMRRLLAGLFLFFAISQAHALTCPEGTALVPAFAPYTGQAHCVMKNEARAPRIEVDKSWNFVSFADADASCRSTFVQGDIPLNAIWQALVRQAELVDANWTGGSVGVGTLKTDLTINGGLSTFYDIGDGLWEHVTGQSPADFSAGFIYLLSASDPLTYTINGLLGNAKYHFGPSGTYTAGAQLGVTTNRYSVYLMRGGDDEENGAFGVAMNHAGEAASDVGFRCSCPLKDCGI
jgi:hypothetical protein